MAWPSNLSRTKDWGTETLTDSDLEGQFDLTNTWVSDAMHQTTGHKHDGTANEGPTIQLSGASIGVTGELQEADGGTGLSAYTLGDVVYASAANTLSALAKSATESHYLSNQGASNIPQWEQVDIATGLAIASEAQGDVIYRGASAYARLGPGTSGQFLQTKGDAANPVWADSISITDEGTFSGATSISITETLATDTAYRLILMATTAAQNATDQWGIRINSDSTATVYGWRVVGTQTANNGSDGEFNITGANDFDLSNATASGIYLVADFIIRASRTQVAWNFYSFGDSASPATKMEVIQGFGEYDAGVATSIQFLRISGSATLTGKYTLYKLNP